MPTNQQVLQELINMSRWLGEESRGFAILGEGNTSAKIDENTFYVKASGYQLGNMSEEGLVEVSAAPVLDMLNSESLSDDKIKAIFKSSMVDRSGKFLPSIETLFHAYLLTIPGVNFVGHTHPVSVNSILCSKEWQQVVRGRIFPDEVVCCGVAPACIDYTDPGVTLARKIRESVEEYTERYEIRPKAILMQNHGLVALGTTAKEVQSVTAMWDKTAKVLAGTYQFGGPHYLPIQSIDRLANRSDEDQRLKFIEGRI